MNTTTLLSTPKLFSDGAEMNMERNAGGVNRSADKKSFRQLSSKKIEEKRRKGLCYWCDDKYTIGHNCGSK